MINTKMGAFLLAAFIAGAFLASPELRVYAANTVFSADIKDGEVKTADLANNAVTSAKIKDGEVKAADLGGSAVTSAKIQDGEVKADDIATDAVGSTKISHSAVGASEIAQDAVGASEIAGVSKLIFVECHTGTNFVGDPGSSVNLTCKVPGARSGDAAMATVTGPQCWALTRALAGTDEVAVHLVNVCSVKAYAGDLALSVFVFDTATVKPPLP